MSTEISGVARGLPAPWFGVMTLPEGMGTGFVSVTLGYVLTHRGVSVAAVAGLVSLYMLPLAWKFLVGPLLDMSLTPRLWFLILTGLQAFGILAIAVTPLMPSTMPLISLFAFLAAVAVSAAGCAKTAVIALTRAPESRGAVAGWQQSGNLGGVGLGGGAGLWIATHAGGPGLAAITLAIACLACGLPMLWVRTPARAAAEKLTVQAASLGRALLTLARARTGALALIAVVLPIGLGAAAGLLPAVAGDWGASANLVALVTGMLGGLVAVPGCIAGGYLCARFPPRIVLMTAGLACAVGEAAMALAPHTPALFAGFVLVNNLLLGVAWASVSGVIFEVLPSVGAATVGSVLVSAGNVPAVTMTALVGLVQTRQGSTAMLLAEAAAAALAVAAYSLLTWLWRVTPAPVAGAPAAAPA